MNVLFVSQCTKRALTETRRILDQFAERRGDRTWQTPITQAGLDTVRKLLRQTARKNTAVACHWIRGRDHSELLWIVGDARQFNAEGATPTGATSRDVLRADDESQWHQLPLMSAMTSLAALLHDLGKATRAFQRKLRGVADLHESHYRHEWVSVRLFQAFVGDAATDADWLQRLAVAVEPDTDALAFETQWLDHAGGRLLRDGLDDAARDGRKLPFAAMPPLAQAVAWLVLTHHRLPCLKVGIESDGSEFDAAGGRTQWRRFGAKTKDLSGCTFREIDAQWNEPRDEIDRAQLESCWEFPHGLPVSTPAWRKQAARYASKLIALHDASAGLLDDASVMHVSRLCLMLADHHYSSLSDEASRSAYRNPDYPLYANTLRYRSPDGSPDDSTISKPIFNQTLDEHLLGVQAHASIVTHSLPTLVRSLPALPNHRGLKRRSRDTRFHWQDKAADLAASLRERSARHGAFVVNMASTGCGKTLGNARIMNGFADPQRGLRCVFAIGLRTLTLQTGRSFQQDLGLRDDQLAIRVGGSVTRELFEHRERLAEASGSGSVQRLLDMDLDADGSVYFEGDDTHPLLQRLTHDAQVRALIAAPLLACTIDHLMPATESLRGGHQIAPMLRLMTSDLVLDEPDDFDVADLPALMRLVHWAGMLGARVLLSSATLPSALVRGLFLSYRDGRRHYQRNRSERPGETPAIACMWVDEFAQSNLDCDDEPAFRAAHQAFVVDRCRRLAQAETRRRARLIDLPESWRGMERSQRRAEFAQRVLDEAWQLHRMPQNHCVDASSGKRVSLGLIRMANIEPLYEVALAMYRHGAPASGARVHLCVYHSQFPLLSRSALEAVLDTAFDRRARDGGADHFLANPAIREQLDRHPEPDHLFVVLASPVCEVGRDWDADWAIAEPSSIRSLIQLAGRVRRHRAGAVEQPNMAVLDTNLRYFEHRGEDEPVFTRPGFEMRRIKSGIEQDDTQKLLHLARHRLGEMLEPSQGEHGWAVDARARILHAADSPLKSALAELEHRRMWDTMLPRDPAEKWHTPDRRDATQHWRRRDGDARHVWLTGAMPQLQPFRDDPVRRVDLVLMPDEEEEALQLRAIVEDRARGGSMQVDWDDMWRVTSLEEASRGRGIGAWAHGDLLDLLRKWADEHGEDLATSACRLATISLPESEAQVGWRYDPVLGFERDT
ncbi:type I-F CRISPR-associated helicase Cas3f [Burkholderia gladioli]|uniref:type I-F CRISPR-associated helicase Cas3f n=1 Tax=Burkholderia gladioli TaxID=28095 RepID=UPI00164216DD|nr:type I-F CRISPR-associated helicase Cas3f [Burkholderia gladioli]